LFGGYTTLMLGTYSYLAATTSIQSRTSRIALLHVLSSAGFTSGYFLSPYVYQSWGFYGTFGTTIVLLIVSILSVLLFIKEPQVEDENQRSLSENPLESIQKAAASILKRRPGNGRRVILLLLLIMLLLVATMSGGGGGYLFTRKMFHWEEMIYTEVGTAVTILSTASNLFLLPFLSYTLEIPDSIIGLMATMSYFSELVVTALAQSGTGYIFGKVKTSVIMLSLYNFLAKCLGLMGGQSSMTIRSLLSKIVPKSDLGKVYAMLGCLENIVPLLFSPVLTYTYNSTLDTFPGAVYAVSASIIGLAVCCFVWVSWLIETEQDFILSHGDSIEEL